MMIHTAIVEDDPMVAQINRQYLQRMGDFHIGGIFTNGKDALEYLQTQPVDLAILDVYMPGINGDRRNGDARGGRSPPSRNRGLFD